MSAAHQMKATPGYAESQVRLLISELNNASHSAKITACKKFSEYILKHKPQVIRNPTIISIYFYNYYHHLLMIDSRKYG